MLTIADLKVLDDHFGVGHRRIISKLLPSHDQLPFSLKQIDDFDGTELDVLRKEGEIHATLELHLHLHVLTDVVSGSDGEEEGGAEDEVRDLGRDGVPEVGVRDEDGLVPGGAKVEGVGVGGALWRPKTRIYPGLDQSQAQRVALVVLDDAEHLVDVHADVHDRDAACQRNSSSRVKFSILPRCHVIKSDNF